MKGGWILLNYFANSGELVKSPNQAIQFNFLDIILANVLNLAEHIPKRVFETWFPREYLELPKLRAKREQKTWKIFQFAQQLKTETASSGRHMLSWNLDLSFIILKIIVF